VSEKGAPTETGVIVETAPLGFYAARAGLQSGDLLLEVNGEVAGSTDKLQGPAGSCRSGQPVKLNGLRNQYKFEFLLRCGKKCR
jgi:S1-C subfamily serine protease